MVRDKLNPEIWLISKKESKMKPEIRSEKMKKWKKAVSKAMDWIEDTQ